MKGKDLASVVLILLCHCPYHIIMTNMYTALTRGQTPFSRQYT